MPRRQAPNGIDPDRVRRIRIRRPHVSTPSAPTKPQVVVINESSVLQDADIGPVLAALQIQASRDFAPVWGRDCDLLQTVFKQSTPPPAAAWWVALLDDSDQAGALGYHDLTPEGLPLAKVFAKTDQAYGLKWTVTVSHELLEMLGDPYINLCAQDPGSGDIYAYEACDAVEADGDGYAVNGIQLSNFVLPYWFTSPYPGTKVDFLGQLQRPLQLRPGGYISVFRNGQWSQENAQEVPGAAASRMQRVDPGTRRERRQRAVGAAMELSTAFSS